MRESGDGARWLAGRSFQSPTVIPCRCRESRMKCCDRMSSPFSARKGEGISGLSFRIARTRAQGFPPVILLLIRTAGG